MSANREPIYTATPKIGFAGPMTTANTSKTAASGTKALVFTAGSNGSFLEEIGFKPHGTNVQTVARIFLNNGSDDTDAANNTMIGEQTLPAITNSETAAAAAITWPCMKKIPAGYRVYVTIGTAVAAGWQPTSFGGDY